MGDERGRRSRRSRRSKADPTGRPSPAAEAVDAVADALAGGAAPPPDDLEPYLALAREIHDEVARVVADDDADAEMLTAAIDAVPQRERAKVAMAVFETLPPELQWSILERTFDDEELRSYLAAERQRRLDEVHRTEGRVALARAARDHQRLDAAALPADVVVTVGLFREADVRAAVERGADADTVARRLVLHSLGDGPDLRVVEDVFNPRGALFVTRAYDESVWATERLEPHTVVRIGAAPEGAGFEPVVYPGGRLDVDGSTGVKRGHLHVGFVTLDGIDVFAG